MIGTARADGQTRSVLSRAGALPPALVLGITWAGCAFYGGMHLDHRWIPHDEGTLAHAAERVAAGGLPHVDYDEVYTGGLSFLNAATFELLGTRLVSLRIVLFVLFLVWVATLLRIALRFMTPTAAALATIAAVAWSVPNYSAPLPSWYNLFFTTFALAALLRMDATGQRRWLWLAGLCAGVSITIKIVGLYAVAAALLYLVHREAGTANDELRESGGAERAEGGAAIAAGGRVYSIFVSAALGVFLLLVVHLVRPASAGTLIDFVLPIAAVVAVLLAREWRTPPARFATRFRRLLGSVLPFLGGVAIPVAILVVPYAWTGSIDALVNGVFVEPAKRLDFAARVPPGWDRPFGALVLAVAIGLPLLRGHARGAIAMLFGAAAIALLMLGGSAAVYRATFNSVVQVLPLALLALAAPLWRREPRAGAQSRATGDGLFLLLAATACWSLVRYPFAGSLYYFYVVPLVVLSAAAVAASLEPARRRTIAGVLAFYALFALLWIGTNSLFGITQKRHVRAADDYMPPMDRAGLRMTDGEAAQYAQLVAAVHERSRSPYIFATPDAPEVYFLTGRLNPTRTIFDFFDEPEGRAARVMEQLQRANVDVVVTKQFIPFSGPVPPDLLHAIEERYPYAQRLGIYIVRWRP